MTLKLTRDGETQSTSQHEKAPWFQWPFYNWVTELLVRGSERAAENSPLLVDDLLELPSFECPQRNARLIREAWARELQLTPTPDLMRVLAKVYWKRTMVGGVFRFLSDGAAFATPFIFRGYINWLTTSAQTSPWQGYVWALGLAATNILMSMTLNAASHHTLMAFNCMKNGLAVIVFDAALNLKNNHGQSGTVILTHAGDPAKFAELGMFFHGTWVSPILIIGAVISLYFFIGYAGLVIVGIMFFTTPLQGVLMARVWSLRGLVLQRVSKRVQAIDEVLQGIRICKFMGWEVPFAKRISDARSSELEVVRDVFSARLLATAFFFALPTILVVALFGIAYAIDPNSITASNVFPALTMLGVIRVPMNFLPMSFSKLMETRVSAGRIQNVMNVTRQQYLERHAERAEPGQPGIIVENCTVTGDGNVPITQPFNVKIPAGKLTIITGPTGSGKSALVSTLVGEAPIQEGGKVTINGTVAYVPQDAWIMNSTVRGNILMGKEFDHEKYVDALLACQLMSDLEQLPASDATEIGERGINLSGGQKQRIAFARAVYAERDVVLMDDPLSAVDPHVCYALVEECILGALKGTTRVLVTHQVQFLPSADNVICVENCAVVFQGSYADYVAYQATRQLASGDHKESPHGAPASPTAKSPATELAAASAARSRTIPAPKEDALFSKEEVKHGDVEWSTYGWYIKLGWAPHFTNIIVLSLCGQAALIISNLILAAWTSRRSVVGYKFSQNDYLQWFGIFAAIAVVFTAARQKVFNIFSLNVASSIHHELTVSVLGAPTGFFDVTPLGRLMNRFTKDIETVDNNIPDSVGMLINLIFTIIGTIFLVCFSAPYLLILLPFVASYFVLTYRFYARTTRGVKRLEGATRSPQMAIMAESLGGLTTIRAYNMEEQFKRTHRDRAIIAARAPYNIRACQRWLSARTEMMGNVVLLATTLLGAVTASVTSGAVISQPPGVISLSVSFAISTVNAVTFLTRTMADLESDMSSTERVKEYTDSIPQERVTVYGSGPDMAPPLNPLWPTTGRIEFKDAQLRYRDGLPLVLKGVSFIAESGQKVGVVGRTGSGKSTIMLSLFRIVELCGGYIAIDGRDIATVDLKDLRKHITIIPQDPLLFAGTIRSNLDPFSTATDDDIWAAIDRVNMRTRVESVAGNCGLGAPVSEKGSNFSVGQRQLLCLARALLKKSRILLLDEATASVDFEADAMIQRTIRSQFNHCTVLTIAHRLATVIDADRILVLNEGNVVEYGRPSDLLATESGTLRDMAAQLGAEQFESLTRVANEAAAKSKLSATE